MNKTRHWQASIKHLVSVDRSRRRSGSHENLTLEHPILSKLATCTILSQFKQVHARILTTGLFRNVFAASRLLKFVSTLLSPLDLPLVNLVFSQIQQPDAFCYNLVIKAHSWSSHPLNSLPLFQKLLLQGICPNEYTFCFLLDCCSQGLALEEGKQLHGHLKKHGLDSTVFAGTSLIHMYGVCGALQDALQSFDQMLQRSDVSWSAIIDAYVDNGEAIHGFALFQKMRSLGIEPNNATFVTILRACAEQCQLAIGRQVHAHVAVRGLELNVTLGTSLVDIYLKSAEIEQAFQVFSAMPKRNVASWNCLIHGLAMNGEAMRALSMFEMMEKDNIRPNGVTFLGILHACSHAGLLADGLKYFSQMTQVYGISPNIKHYGCLIDLCARAGRVEEAITVVREIPVKPDIVIWFALLGGCRAHGCKNLKEMLAAQIVKVAPCDTCGYLLLSEAFATANCWNDVGRVRDIMKEMDIRKIAGRSSIAN